MYQIRIQKEIALLKDDPPEGVQIVDIADGLVLVLEICSLTTKVRLQLTITPRYPILPPQAVLLPPVVSHPNIDRSGNICLDLLKDSWKPSIGLSGLLSAIRVLLDHPNLDDPLNVDAATKYNHPRAPEKGAKNKLASE